MYWTVSSSSDPEAKRSYLFPLQSAGVGVAVGGDDLDSSSTGWRAARQFSVASSAVSLQHGQAYFAVVKAVSDFGIDSFAASKSRLLYDGSPPVFAASPIASMVLSAKSVTGVLPAATDAESRIYVLEASVTVNAAVVRPYQSVSGSKYTFTFPAALQSGDNVAVLFRATNKAGLSTDAPRLQMKFDR